MIETWWLYLKVLRPENQCTDLLQQLLKGNRFREIPGSDRARD